MSLILEALKKSEAKRRLGEAPDLDTPFATRPQRRSPLPFVVAAIVVASIAGWWWLRPSAPPPATAAQAPPVRGAAVATAKTPMRPQMQNPLPAHPTAPLRHAVADARTGPESASKWVATQRSSDAIPNYKRKLGMSRQPISAPTPAPASAPPAAPTPPVPKPAAPPATIAPSAPALAPKTTASTAPVGKAPKTATTIGRQAPTPATAAPAAGFPAGTKSYAELPFSVRKALPALKLSMHVYAADPAQRFVILNDSRMVEGDKTSDEVTLREIRPDGVVLEFQGQSFFYPRDGF